MKSNPVQFAWDMHQKFMSHKGATEDQFTSFVGTLPRAMGAMIEFFTHGQGLAARDLALGKNPIGLAAAGNDFAAQNPVAALASLRTSIEQFGAALTAGPVQQAGAQLVALAQHITEAAAAVEKFETHHPGITKAATYGAEGVGGLAALGLVAAGAKWVGGTALGGLASLARGVGLGGLLRAGGGAAAEAVAGAEVGGEAGSLLGPWGTVGGAVAGGAAGALGLNISGKIGTRFRCAYALWAATSCRLVSSPARRTPTGVALSGGADNAKLAAASAMPVNVQGQAELNQTLSVNITLDPEIRAQIAAARQSPAPLFR